MNKIINASLIVLSILLSFCSDKKGSDKTIIDSLNNSNNNYTDIKKENIWPKPIVYENENWYLSSLIYWEYTVKEFKRPIDVIEITDSKLGQRAIMIGVEINSIIENSNISEFKKHLSKKIKWYGHPSYYRVKNMKYFNYNLIIKDLESFSYYYGLIFNRKIYLKEQLKNDNLSKLDGAMVTDIRTYIKNHKKWFKWKVLYDKKNQIYIIMFSIDDMLIEEFEWFHYRVKIIDKYNWEIVGL